MADEHWKTLDEYFTDWEAHVFGFGYGTGEHHTIPALRAFFELCPEDSGYDYKHLEGELTPTVAWLLINALAHADIIEYGTSPRYGWLTHKGKALGDYICSKSASELVALTNRNQDYPYCAPDVCNCGPEGYDENRVCRNPFFHDHPQPNQSGE